MLVSRILYPVTALGPGNRVGVWVNGCNRRCKCCANPELQVFDESKRIPVAVLLNSITSICESRHVDGITISGGEPFEQTEELAEFLQCLRIPDILVFTGYRIEELQARRDKATDTALSCVAVLVDGEYVDELNSGSPLRGSDNQRIHILKQEFMESYGDYLEREREYQTFSTSEGVFAIGLHKRGFLDDLQNKLRGEM